MKARLEEQGYLIINDIFTASEVELIVAMIERANTSGDAFRKTKDLFAIRRVLQEIPDIIPYLFKEQFKKIITVYCNQGCFITKSIYFDKPAHSNWFVAYHQDLTISVDKKMNIPGFGPWTVKQDQFAVQPPVAILQRSLTFRIHLDDTDETNGALKVIPGSHRKGIYRPETIDWQKEREEICRVKKGGVMLMSPLLLHASARSTDAKRRRVIHIECNDIILPEGLNWSEKMLIGTTLYPAI